MKKKKKKPLLIYYVCRATKPNLQLICCPIGRPKTEVGVGSSNLNLATLWLNCVRLTSLNCLKFSGSKQPVSAYHDIRRAQINIITAQQNDSPHIEAVSN